MTTQSYNATHEISADELAHLQTQLDGKTPEQSKAERGFRPAAIVATRQEITFRGGQVVEQTSVNKSAGERTAYVNQPKPGIVNIGGMETSVAAAKAAGLLPAHWQEGMATGPFDQASTQGAYGATQSGAKGCPVGATPSAEKGAHGGAESHAEHTAKVAGEVLHGVVQVHGPGVAEGLLSEVAENGDPESILNRLPAGVTDTHVNQVMAGYVAQANDRLGAVGSSVDMLEEVLGEDDLRRARVATLRGDDAALHELGQRAVNMLTQMPETDPAGFMEMVSGMSKAERECIRFDKNSREWRVTVSGQPEMSFGAAVRLGVVRV